ncbi:MAG: hypothetical protein ACREL5_02515 [Gemmatimonadales bacterium]
MHNWLWKNDLRETAALLNQRQVGYISFMHLFPLIGHDETRLNLSRAVGAERLPQVLLFTGPAGVGKQRLALWLGQLLLCRSPGAEPCGACAGCRQVLGVAHPDLHWFVPVPRSKPGDPDRQVDEVAESLEAVMAERRQSPLWTAPDGMAMHGVASARLLQRQASLTSVAGGWRVYIVGRADRLVPQESSPEAANALLKLFEEPPPRSLFVLTAAEPGLVLPTIRSRATPVRLSRLGDADVAAFLTAAGVSAGDDVIRRARGSIGAALASESEGAARARAAARAFAEAAAGGERQVMERVLRQAPWQARGEFTDMLDALAGRLAARLRRAASAENRVSTSDAAVAVSQLEDVLAARRRAQGNVNPQLLLAALADELMTPEMR